MATGVVLSQVPHRRQQTQLGRQATIDGVMGHVAGPPPQPPTSQRHMDTTISIERERVSTGAVLSQERQRRHQTQLSRQGSIQIVPSRVAGSPPQPPPLSDTWTRISQMRGNACQRVWCSHKYVSSVSKPSSVGRLLSRLLPYAQLDHHHSHHLSATHGHEYLK